MTAQLGVNQDELRRHNLSVILTLIHRQGPKTRSELVSATGLNRTTIGALVADLRSRGLVEETTTGPGQGPGRPSTLVAPRKRSVVVLSIEIAVDSIAVATVGLSGHIFESERIDRDRSRLSPAKTIDDVLEIALPLLEALRKRRELWGIGVAVVGIVESKTGEVVLAPNLGWRHVGLGQMLLERLGADVTLTVGNEADLGVIAEHTRGAGVGIENLVFISGEVGVGGGIVVNGNLLEGYRGLAGEIGHTPVNPQGIACGCGSIGCWETEIGEDALLRHMGRHGGNKASIVKEILLEAERGDARAMSALERIGQWLGSGMAGVINTFNPQRIILGGLFGRIYTYIDSVVDEQLRLKALDAAFELVSIVPAKLGDSAPLIGAAERTLLPLLQDPTSFPTVQSQRISSHQPRRKDK